MPPVAPADAKGLRVILTSRQAGKLGVGDPVLYDGFTVGRVEQVSFDINSKRANYQLFIFEPYDSLVRTSSNFILASGVKVQVGAEGFNVKIGSLESLITGGVTFTTLRLMIKVVHSYSKKHITVYIIIVVKFAKKCLNNTLIL